MTSLLSDMSRASLNELERSCSHSIMSFKSDSTSSVSCRRSTDALIRSSRGKIARSASWSHILGAVTSHTTSSPSPRAGARRLKRAGPAFALVSDAGPTESKQRSEFRRPFSRRRSAPTKTAKGTPYGSRSVFRSARSRLKRRITGARGGEEDVVKPDVTRLKEGCRQTGRARERVRKSIWSALCIGWECWGQSVAPFP
ncbi:hypothetical protein EJ03DRAFT_211221 [Teratosphaeria nubilosa]|uniref:Uncharacterized protein n=1 Tax=Teratosphaeria nubilosa TaxID=161662 RepID=A0A6G1LGD6_9PEZI|nr:hypothetical protein EJ03DRAFT_211221 [Teratosphaeria nubilosa]